MHSSDAVEIKAVLSMLVQGDHLSRDEMRDVFTTIMTGGADDAQVASLLTSLALRGVSVDELCGAAQVMRQFVTPVPVDESIRDEIIDTCGTGGAPKTFNVSTLAAVVAAGAGAKVAKHGNRSRTGRGSAEILESLGVNVNASPEVQAACLGEAGVCFSFAIHHHGAVKYAMPARRSLGFATIFNLLGPMTNPAGARRQLIGVYDVRFTDLVAQALASMGSVRAMIVHGLDGLDELSTTGPTRVVEYVRGEIESYEVSPGEVGLAKARLSDLRVDSLEDATALFRRVLDGEKGAARDIVVLNAGAALLVADRAGDLQEGVALAQASIDDGRAGTALERLVAISQG